MGAVALAGLVAVGYQQSAAPVLSVSSGLATGLKPVAGMAPCTNPGAVVQPDVFPIQTGTVTSADGKSWTAPGPAARGDICRGPVQRLHGVGAQPGWENQLHTVVIDPDGVEITGYIFADNYYELYVNGVFVARDRLAMTPFNSTVVRFRARYPMTYAIKAIDWETRYGLGMEYQAFNIGDGGSSPISATATARMPTGGPRRSTSPRSTIRLASGCPEGATRVSALRRCVRPARRRTRRLARRCTSTCRRSGRHRRSTRRLAACRDLAARK